MSITFKDKKEAMDYKKEKEQEGYVAYLTESHEQYIVGILGKTRKSGSKVVNIPQKATEHGNIANYIPKIDTIEFGTKATTTIKAHEVGHARLGHTAEYVNERRAAEEEIDAQIYAMNKMGRKVDYLVALPAINRLEEYKLPPKNTVYLVKSILDRRGIELPKEVEKYWIEEYV
jgi:hypothetical protein